MVSNIVFCQSKCRFCFFMQFLFLSVLIYLYFSRSAGLVYIFSHILNFCYAFFSDFLTVSVRYHQINFFLLILSHHPSNLPFVSPSLSVFVWFYLFILLLFFSKVSLFSTWCHHSSHLPIEDVCSHQLFSFSFSLYFPFPCHYKILLLAFTQRFDFDLPSFSNCVYYVHFNKKKKKDRFFCSGLSIKDSTLIQGYIYQPQLLYSSLSICKFRLKN